MGAPRVTEPYSAMDGVSRMKAADSVHRALRSDVAAQDRPEPGGRPFTFGNQFSPAMVQDAETGGPFSLETWIAGRNLPGTTNSVLT